jgi:hypothetical protein
MRRVSDTRCRKLNPGVVPNDGMQPTASQAECHRELARSGVVVAAVLPGVRLLSFALR